MFHGFLKNSNGAISIKFFIGETGVGGCILVGVLIALVYTEKMLNILILGLIRCIGYDYTAYMDCMHPDVRCPRKGH